MPSAPSFMGNKLCPLVHKIKLISVLGAEVDLPEKSGWKNPHNNNEENVMRLPTLW